MNSSCCVICELNWIVFMAIVKHFRVKIRKASFCCVKGPPSTDRLFDRLFLLWKYGIAYHSDLIG